MLFEIVILRITLKREWYLKEGTKRYSLGVKKYREKIKIAKVYCQCYIILE